MSKIRFFMFMFGLIIIAFVYSAGLPGDFEFDDGVNLFGNKQFIFKEHDWENMVRATFSSDSGPLGRPVSMFSFALNQYFTGADPYWFKVTNITIHLLNTGLIFGFCILLMRAGAKSIDDRIRSWIPLVVAVIWGLLPFNLTSVLYIVQRMTSLSATFMLIALSSYLYGRLELLKGRFRSFWFGLVGFVVSGCLAVFAKESAVLLPLFMLLCELYLLGFLGGSGRVDRSVLAVNLGIAIVPVVLVFGYVLTHPNWIVGGYGSRAFTLEERLLTEPRALWFYLQQILLPNIQSMGLYHDDFGVSKGIIEPLTTLFSLFGIAALVVAAILLRRRQPLVGLGIAWFLVGHLLESTFWPLELIHEHRNYFPSIGVVLAFVGLLASVPDSLKKLIWRGVLPAIAVAYASATYARALQWQNLTDHAISEAHNHPNSSRATFQLGRIYAKWLANSPDQRYYLAAKESFERSIAVDPEKRSGGYFGLIHLAYQADKVPDPKILGELVELLSNTSAIGLDLAFLGQLARCQVDRACKLPDEQFEAIASAFLKNPRLSDGFRASVLSILGVYSANKKDDWQAAEHYFIEAARLANRAEHWLALGEYYRAVGYFDFAREAIIRAQATSDSKRYGYEIEAFSANLERTITVNDQMVRGGE